MFLVYQGSKGLKKLNKNTISLEEMWEEVGGYIEQVGLASMLNQDIGMFVNEEGRFSDLPVTAYLAKNNDPNSGIYDYIQGNILFVGINDEGDTVPLTKEQAEYIEAILKAYTAVVPTLSQEYLPVICNEYN